MSKKKKFKTTAEAIADVKKSVFVIARGRKIDIEGRPDAIQWYTIGSGFLVAPNRLLTCSHVLDDKTKGEHMQHRDGDKYLFIRHTDDGNVLYHLMLDQVKLNEAIFLNPDLDIAIIYLQDSFYESGGVVHANRDEFIRVCQDPLPIGTEVGLLGYPLCKVEFESGDLLKPKLGNILLRADSGIVNSCYRTAESLSVYEFTMAFNPGNSGGPIFDLRTGRLVAIVKGYRFIPISREETEIGADFKLKYYKEKSFIEVHHASYSVGVASTSLLTFLKVHRAL